MLRVKGFGLLCTVLLKVFNLECPKITMSLSAACWQSDFISLFANHRSMPAYAMNRLHSKRQARVRRFSRTQIWSCKPFCEVLLMEMFWRSRGRSFRLMEWFLFQIVWVQLHMIQMFLSTGLGIRRSPYKDHLRIGHDRTTLVAKSCDGTGLTILWFLFRHIKIRKFFAIESASVTNSPKFEATLTSFLLSKKQLHLVSVLIQPTLSNSNSFEILKIFELQKARFTEIRITEGFVCRYSRDLKNSVQMLKNCKCSNYASSN